MLDRVQSKSMLHEMRTLQRKRRVEEVDWVDAIYRAYVILVLSLIGVLVVSAIVGDGHVGHATVADIERNGAPILSIGLAFVIAGALRSGSRGGPHSLQPADVHHLLLAPLERDLVLRGPAIRQLRVIAVSSTVLGAIAGNLALRRLPGGGASWVLYGAAFGACAGLAMWGAAAMASGHRLSRVAASLAGLGLIAWAGLDLALHVTTAPTTWISAIAILPLRTQYVAVVGPIVALAAAIAGFIAIGGISIEATLRRSGLVGQLRFAATVQDLRVVILLHRQLASELPRRKPWIRHRAHGSLAPVWRRDWSAIMRWPASRVLRVIVLGGIAIAAAIGAWLGTTPLIVVAGIAAFVAALDVSEGLAQEVDHPTLVDARPVSPGWLYARHLAAPVAVLAVIAAVPLGVLALSGHASTTVSVAAATAITAIVGTIAGASLSIVLGPPPLGSPFLMSFPEIMGTLLIARQAVAPGLAIAGFLPIAFAVHALHSGHPVVDAANATIGPVLIASGIAIGYIGSRGAKRY